MKIAIDISQIIYGTGVSVYTKNLIRALLTIDRKNEYKLIGGSLRRFYELNRQIGDLSEGKKNADSLIFPVPPSLADFLFNRSSLINIDPFIGSPDVFHSSDWTQPASDAYKITTVHDLAPLLYPNMTHPRIVDVHKRRLERVRKYADHIIVPTFSAKNDLIRMGFREKAVSVVYEAVDSRVKKPLKGQKRRVLDKYRISGKYVLAVGANKRKNTDGIIAAFEKIRHDGFLKLVVIGEQYHEVVRNVLFLGHVPNSDVPSLYSCSEALVYPSFYEGFGLPILEAFYLETPVVTSNRGSMEEIGGDSAVLVEPDSVESIADGILTALSRRDRLIKKGRERVKAFSWEKCARETLYIYNKKY